MIYKSRMVHKNAPLFQKLFVSEILRDMLLIVSLCVSLLGTQARLENLISIKNNGNVIRKYHENYLHSVMDKSVDPCEDFSTYSCGRWSSVVSIPRDKLRYDVIQMMKSEVLKALNASFQDENFFKDFLKDDVVYLAKEYYESCMDVIVLKKQGIKPLQDFITVLGSCRALDDGPRPFPWAELIAKLHLLGKTYIFAFYIDIDFGDSSKSILYLDQPPLENADKDDYEIEGYFEEYKKKIRTIVLQLGGKHSEAESVAQEIYNFEAELARISRNENKRSHRAKLYIRRTFGELSKLYPLIDWKTYLTALLNTSEIKLSESILVEDRYLKGLTKVLSRTKEDTIYNYVIIKNALSLMDLIVTNKTDISSWWKTCVQHVSNHMNTVADLIFSRRYLKSKKREEVKIIWNDVKTKFREILQNSTLIDSKTRTRAIRKIETMTLSVGIPHFMTRRSHRKRYFKNVDIKKDKFFESTTNLMAWNNMIDFADLLRVSSTTDLTDVQGSYSTSTNTVSISAGMLQMPFYHSSLPMYQKYGVVGFILSHEIAHGFDDDGRFYDHKGEANSWITRYSLAKYNQRAKCFIEQYDRLKMDGNFTLGENLADNVGLQVSYFAYKDWVERNKYKSLVKNENITGLNLSTDELFFLSFGQFFCEMNNVWSNFPDPNDVHPRHDVRVKATVSNSKPFADSFNCSKKSMMNPIKKCKLW